MHITFIQTGGTIDKDYPRGETHHGYNFAIGDPAIKSVLSSSHVLFTHDVVEVTKKDGLDLTDGDRKKIVEVVVAAPADRVVITHGTDTIQKTAAAISKKVNEKTIVLTGAMLPEKFSASDAKFNVGMAVGAVQNLPPGIYIALYGRVVPWQDYKQLNEEYERTRHAPL